MKEVINLPVPSSMKITKNGVEYTSSVDKVKYTIAELTRAALKDVGKFLRKRMIQKVKVLPGLRKSKRPYNAFQYWVRKKETDLIVGIKHGTWYGEAQELGSSNQPKRAILRDTTYDNINDIMKIEGQYLSAINDENEALGLINEEEEIGADED